MARANGILRELRNVFEIEIEALQSVMRNISPEFVHAVQTIARCKGRVVVTGIGKSGIVANKIAATLTSTGTPAIYVHAGEALHGDIGIISPSDVMIAIGKSGESGELTTLLPIVRKIGAKIIAVTASAQSRMAKSSDIVLELKIPREACPLNLAPTSSTTASLVLGDAIAVALMKLKKVSPADYARTHPGGQLGRRLLLQVSDIMRTGSRNPIVKINDTVRHMLALITEGQAGAISVIGPERTLAGLVSDYDVRKVLERGDEIFDLRISDIMNPKPMFVFEDQMATEALDLMRSRKKPTNILPVLSRDQKIVGMVHIMDLVSAGI
ncbi:MAG TPA: KpsF/GutQ family sugar-phosphate isomerase [Terriglobia bacterium]|nr:KpsF/GutQ family sugar-phosphate isomerase [Terriglobia bacterium]